MRLQIHNISGPRAGAEVFKTIGVNRTTKERNFMKSPKSVPFALFLNFHSEIEDETPQ